MLHIWEDKGEGKLNAASRLYCWFSREILASFKSVQYHTDLNEDRLDSVFPSSLGYAPLYFSFNPR